MASKSRTSSKREEPPLAQAEAAPINQQQHQRQITHFRPIADAIAVLYAPYTEVVVHDLASQTVVHIANNLSKREIGDDSALEDIDFDNSTNVIGPYEKQGWDGKTIRSISVVLRTEQGEPVGVMCINFHLAALDHAKQALELLLSSTAVQPRPEQLFKDDWQDRVNVFLNHWLQEKKVTLAMLTREQKRELVTALFAEGAFNGKSAANYVAKVLSLGRATVFNYLKELRNQK